MKAILELLKKRNLIDRQRAMPARVESLSISDIVDISQEIVSKTSETRNKKNNFSYCASFSLGGSREDCRGIKCRLRKIDSLARFASLYADTVYIENYFNKYVIFKDEFESRNRATIAQDFIEDITVLNAISPLLESGHIVINTPPKHFCPFCLAKSSFGQSAIIRMKKAIKRIKMDFESNSAVKLCVNHKDELYLRCSGPSLYYEHGGIIGRQDNLADRLKAHKKLLSKVHSDKEVTLSKKIRRELGVPKVFADQVVRNICYELAMSQALGTAFLTNKELHISFLNSISEGERGRIKNEIALKNLTACVPFLEDVELSDLLVLRRREEEAFTLFRHALNKAIAEFVGHRGYISKTEASALYLDVIQPKLVSLDQKVKLAKRDLVRKPIRTAIAAVGAISFGLYAGFVPSEVKQLVSALGTTLGGTEFIKQLMAMRDAEDSIKSDNLYFLWKVKRMAKKTR